MLILVTAINAPANGGTPPANGDTPPANNTPPANQTGNAPAPTDKGAAAQLGSSLVATAFVAVSALMVSF